MKMACSGSCRISSSIKSGHPLASLARPPARHPPVAGFRLPFVGPPLHQHAPCPPPRRSGLRFPTPVGHGRGLASRPGWAVPGEGVGSPCLRLCLPRFATLETRSRNLRRSACARLHPRPGDGKTKFLPPQRQPAAARLRSRLSLSAVGSASPTQACSPLPKQSCLSFGVNRPGCVPCQTGSRLFFCLQSKLPGKQPPQPKRRPAVAAGGAPRLKTFLPIRWPIR